MVQPIGENMSKPYGMQLHWNEALPLPLGSYEEWIAYLNSEIVNLEDYEFDGLWDEGLTKEAAVELIRKENGL